MKKLPISLAFFTAYVNASIGHQLSLSIYKNIFSWEYQSFEQENKNEIVFPNFSRISSVSLIVLSNKTTRQIALNLTKDNIKITTEDNEKSSKGFENISGNFTGEDLVIGYNAAYLKDITDCGT